MSAEEQEDRLFQEALEKCGVTLEQLEAKTFEVFLDAAGGDEVIATKRFSHYESARQKKLYLVQQQMTALQAKQRRTISDGGKMTPHAPSKQDEPIGLTLCIRRRMVIDKEREREELARKRVEQQRAEEEKATADEIEKLRLQREQENGIRETIQAENVRQAILRQQRDMREKELLRERREAEMLQEEKNAALQQHLAQIEQSRAKRREALAKLQDARQSARRQERYLEKKSKLEQAEEERKNEVERLEAQRARDAQIKKLLRQDHLAFQRAKAQEAEKAALKRAKELQERKFQEGLASVRSTDEKAALATTTQREKLLAASQQMQKDLESSLDSARRRRVESATTLEQRRKEVAETNEIRRQVRIEEAQRRAQLREEDTTAKLQAVADAKIRIKRSQAAQAGEIAAQREQRLRAAEERRVLMLEALFTPTR
jgi:hypothetical protein